MLVTKRFYCLSPLICVVLHSMVMFSMVQASPMENIGGHGDNQNALNWLTKEMEDDDNASEGYDSGVLQNYEDGLLRILQEEPNQVASNSHPIMFQDQAEKGLATTTDSSYTSEQLAALVTEIRRFKPSKSERHRILIKKDKETFFNYGGRGKQFLEMVLWEPTLSKEINPQNLMEIIPLFFFDEG